MRRRRWLLAFYLALLAGCAGDSASTAPGGTSEGTSEAQELTVFAAASLTDAFNTIGREFGAASGVRVTFNFGGSDQLATQIIQGAPADVFASANSRQMDVAISAGEVARGSERTFARNRLVVVYPRDNPAGLKTLQDLARPGLKLVLANKDVPVGGYALDVLARASLLPEYTSAYSPSVIANVVSYEENVRAVLSKVSLGEADAGIVYATDAASVDDGSIATLDIPDALNSIASYPIAPTTGGRQPELARRFVEFVLSPAGQQILAAHGFIRG